MTIHSHLEVTVCASPSEAIRNGFLYREPIYKSITVERVVVVKNGTNEGNSSLDFILIDDKGQKHVFMVTSALLHAISGIS